MIQHIEQVGLAFYRRRDPAQTRRRESKLGSDAHHDLGLSIGDHIVAIFFDVDDGVEREHASPEDPFTLSIDLLYSTETDPAAAEAAARSAAEAITAVFRDRCFDKANGRWRGIELLACTPISDEALTYAMSLRLKRWNAEYISLRADPAQPMIDE
jgi:hypothetical protein